MKAKARQKAPPVRRISNAPPPPTELSGRASWMPPRPKPMQVPSGLPLYYPNELKLQTRSILGSACKKFPVQTQIEQLCKYVISELTPHACAAVRGKKLRAELALSKVNDLLRSLLVYNCDEPSERSRLEQELLKSDEWLKLAGELLAVAKTAERVEEAGASASAEKSAAAHPPNRDPEIEKRNAIIRQNSKAPSQGLYTLLDNSRSPLPKRWPYSTWGQAYKDRKYRSRIQVIFSKAKKTPA